MPKTLPLVEQVTQLPLVFPRAAALVASTLVHVGVATVVGGHLPESRVNGSPVAIAIDVAMVTTPPESPLPETPAKSSVPHGGDATHRHPYQAVPDHDADPHDSSAPHRPAVPAPFAAPPAAVVEAPPSDPARFILPTGSALVSHGAAPTVRTGGANASSTGEETVGEAQVSAPARLLAGGTASYTVEAREAGIEIDVPVQIVVDGFGRVVDARTETVTGYGLDDAAVRCVRSYRFSPAVKDGRRVRVRMRWTVQFRLR